MSDETTTDMLAEIDRDMVEIETLVADLARQSLQADYPQQVETTTDVLAEIEGQAEYTPPEGWRVVAVGEKLQAGDMWVWPNSDEQRPTIHVGAFVGSNQRYIRRIEPQSKPQSKPQPQPQPQPEPQPELQPVQVCEGRWRTRGGEIRNVTPTPEDDDRVTKYPWYDAKYDQTWASNGRYYLGKENQRDLVQYVGPIEQPDKIITQDDVAAEALAGAINEWPSVQIVRREVEKLQEELGQAKRRIVELETLVADLRTINDAQEKAVRAAGRQNVDLQHRLDVGAFELGQQVQESKQLREQLEAVKAELVQQTETSRRLQIELDAREQVPTSRDDRFEQGWDAGTAQAVETIAEWLEPLRTCGRQGLSLAVIQNLPHIMRTLTGLAQED